MRILTATFALIALARLLAPTAAGPDLDVLVDSFRLDQDTTPADQSRWSSVMPEAPVGQTFVTSRDAVRLCRIAVSVATWNEEWSEGESLVMTVYDGPDRGTKLGSFAMPYKWKTWEGTMVMFPFSIPVDGGKAYYFELTVEGGDGRMQGLFHSSREYGSGQLYEGGRPGAGDLAFETHVRKAFDRDAEYAGIFGQWYLDSDSLSGVRAAVDKKDWDAAARELVKYYESRADLLQPVTPEKKPGYDRSYDDLVADMKIRDEHGQVWELGPDWNHYITWPLRGGVGLTRTGIRKYLAGGYRNTADEKFAIAWNDMILKTLRDQPSPLRAGAIRPDEQDVNPAPRAGIRGGSMWGALSIGARMSNLWYFYQSVMKSPNFTTDARCAMIFNMVDMANVLSMYKGGGNWETQIGDALLEFGQTHPELKRSKEWFEKGLATLIRNAGETIYPDGVLHEPSINYHGLVTNRFLQLIENARRNHFAVPTSIRRRVEKMIEFMMYSTSPDWRAPATGDTFAPFSAEDYFRRGAGYFGRSDFLWMATKGAQGQSPLQTSVPFRFGGWYTMRSDWGPEALSMQIHNGDCQGHGHNDALQMTAHGYGSELLIDPGMFVYGTPEGEAISRTRAHGTITVDGRDAVRAGGPTRWESNRAFDYFDGTNAGYEGLEGVKMRRQVVFVKPQYWVVLDTVTGSGTHRLDSRFVCPAGKAEVHGDGAAFQGRHAGLAVLVRGDDGAKTSIETGRRPGDRASLTDIPVITRTIEGDLPLSLGQVLMPHPGTLAPRVRARWDRTDDGSWRVTVTSGGGSTDIITFANDGSVEVRHLPAPRRSLDAAARRY